ncbi:hypothetical protein J3E68DRAFT_391617 [Trichoderma sp. SZMC 28012]
MLWKAVVVILGAIPHGILYQMPYTERKTPRCEQNFPSQGQDPTKIKTISSPPAVSPTCKLALTQWPPKDINHIRPYQ